MTVLSPPGGLPLGPMGAMPLPPVPGIDVVQKLLQSLGLDPTILVTLGMAFTVFASLGGFLSYAWNGLSSVWALISNNCVSSATIHSSDQAFLYIMKWLATQKISTDCREFCVTSKKNPNSARVKRYSMYNYHAGGGAPDDDDEDDEEDDLGPKLKYNPAPGWSHFWFRKHLIIMQRKVDRAFYNGEEPDEIMVLMTIGRSPTLLRALLSEARASYVASESRKTTVYSVNTTGYQKGWDNGRSRASRDISTVIMEKQDKELILRDTKDYLNPVTARWYAARGLPYRRGYLFYGPPGTGKTSLTLALAGELKLNLYIFNLGAGGGVTDETLGQLFQALPRKCIVLLEDIDCAGIGRGFSGNDDYESDTSDDENADDENDSNTDEDANATKSESSDSKPKDSKTRNKAGPSTHGRTGSQSTSGRHKQSQVSFSGLLNAIDGVASHEGRILIMTTNHRERLDPALIRPGRVDLQIEFGYSTHDTIRRVFTELYKGLGDLTPSPTPVSLSRSATCENDDEFGPVWQPSGSGSPTTDESPSHKFENINPSTWSANLCRRDSIRDADLDDLAERFAKAVPSGVFTPAELQGYLMMHKHDPRTAVRGVGDWVRGKLIEKGKNPDGSAVGVGARKKKIVGGRVSTSATGGKVKEAATPVAATTTTAVTSLNSPNENRDKPLTQKPQLTQPHHVTLNSSAQPRTAQQPHSPTTTASTPATSQPQQQHQPTRINLRQRRNPSTLTRQQSWETSDGVSTVGSSGAATDSGDDEDDYSEPNNLQPHRAPATPVLLPIPPVTPATTTKKGGRSSAARKKLRKAIKGVAS